MNPRMQASRWTLALMLVLTSPGRALASPAAVAHAQVPPLEASVSLMLRDVDTVDGTPRLIEVHQKAAESLAETESQAGTGIAQLQASANVAVDHFARLEKQIELDPRTIEMVRKEGTNCDGLAVLYLGHSSIRDSQGRCKKMYLLARSLSGRVAARVYVLVQGAKPNPVAAPTLIETARLDAGMLAGQRAQVVLLPSYPDFLPRGGAPWHVQCVPQQGEPAR